MAVTNKDLKKAFGFSSSQIRRWAVLALGKDPAAPQAGGVSRQYDIDDAFLIFLLGILITEYNFGQKEAQYHVLNIGQELKNEGLLPSRFKQTMYDYQQLYKSDSIITVYLTILSGPYYKLKIQLYYQKTDENGVKRYKEEYIEKEFFEKNKNIESSFKAQYILDITVFFVWFMSKLFPSK